MKWLLLLSLFPLCAETEVLTLKRACEDRQEEVVWNVKGNEQELTIIGSDSSGKTTIKGDANYSFTSFTYDGKPSSYSISQEGQTLTVSGTTEKGVTSTKRYSLKGEPWVQQFWFGLMPFLRSSATSFKFSIINPEDFSKVAMVAYKQGTEPLTIGHTTYAAQKVKVTLQGFKSVFWSGKAWYDAKDHTFLRYEANKGPNTPITTIFLKNFSKQ